MPPRAPFSLLVTAIRMVKSASSAREIQILRPLMIQSSPSRTRARDHPGGIGRRRRARRCRSPISFRRAHRARRYASRWARVHRRHHHAQVRRVRRQGVGRDAAPQFLVDPDHRHRRQVGAADVFRRVQAPQPELLRHLVDPRLLLRPDPKTPALGLARQHAGLQRHQFVRDEAMHEILEHAVLFAEFEIHGGRSPRDAVYCANAHGRPRREAPATAAASGLRRRDQRSYRPALDPARLGVRRS